MNKCVFSLVDQTKKVAFFIVCVHRPLFLSHHHNINIYHIVIPSLRLLKAHLNFTDPFMCGLSGFRAKAVITFESLQFKETLVFGFPRSARSCVIAFGDSGDFRQINHPFTVKIFPGIVIAHLMFGRVKDKPSLFPTFDFEIGLQKNQIKNM